MPDVEPLAALKAAKELAGEGRYKEALQKHLWFHDHALEHGPALAGVRLSFALADWLELGNRYPPARQALVAVRDRKARAIADGVGSFELFFDVSAINEALGEEARTVALFERLHLTNPELAARCYHVAEGVLVAHRQYDLCIAYIPDPLARLEQLREVRRLQLELAAENPALDRPDFRHFLELNFAGGADRLIHILRGVGREEEAERVRALAVAESEAVRAIFEDAEPTAP